MADDRTTDAVSGTASGSGSGPPRQTRPAEPVAGETASVSAYDTASTPAAQASPAAPATAGTASVSAYGQAGPAGGGVPERGLLIATALLTVASVIVYYLGYQVVDQRPLSEAWVHQLAYPVELALVAGLLTAHRRRFAALLAGMLAWEWMNIAITLHRQAREALPEEWALLVIAAVLAVAAQVCAFTVIARTRTDIPATERRLTTAVAAVSALLAAAAPLTEVAALMQYYYLDTSEGGVFRTVTSLICAAVLPVVVLLRPADRLDAWVAAGWFLGGAALLTSLTVHYVGDDRESDLTSTTSAWILVALTAALVAAAAVRRQRV